jgi:membrane protein DedA with SNARE-associated domain
VGSLSHSIQTFVAAHGLEAVFLLMVLESACIPVSSEVTMIYAGYLVSQGDMSFVGAVIVGAFANLVGSWIAWAVGAYGVDAWLYRSDRNRRHAEQAHRWFERYGTPVVFFSRLVPIVRTFISLPAGVARMPLGRFSLLTILGCLPWSFLRVAIGDAAGANWETWHRRLGSLDYVVVAAGLALVGAWLLRRRRSTAE